MIDELRENPALLKLDLYCKGLLSTRRFPWQRVKRKALAAAFCWRFRRRPAAAGL